MNFDRVCVYCGSSDKINAHYLEAADQMGVELAERGKTIVYGGGGTGLMGALASAALRSGGEVIGVLPGFFDTPELAHNGLTELHRVENMHERKALMAELADAFIALPGGYGTFEELFEILTWAQIGIHNSPIGMLNISGYFDPLIELIEHAQNQGFIYAEHRDLINIEADPAKLLDQLTRYQPPAGLERWVDRRKDES